jgi:hypothetical protein
MSKRKATELHANPLTAPPRPTARADDVPLWKVWRWSLAHPNESPWRDDEPDRR